MNYGINNNNIFRISIKQNGTIILISYKKYDGFHEYINVVGEINNNLFVKEVSKNDLEDAYALKYEIVYKGIRFKAFQPEDLYNDGKMEIWTDYDDIAEKYDFERMDMFFYYKLIEEKDIEELVEIREPIFQFKDTKKVTKQVIPKDKIMQYAEYIASFA